jgi:hypothetical protein
VCPHDALDDRQSEADACLVAAGAFGPALERFGECRYEPWRELLPGVLDREHHRVGADAGRDLHGAVLGEVVDDGIVQQVRRHLQKESVGAEGGGEVPGGLDGDPVLLRQGEECLGGFLRQQ